MLSESSSEWFTLGQVAERCNAKMHRVRHIIRTRGIKPIGRAGVLRLFDAVAVEEVRRVLREIDAINALR